MRSKQNIRIDFFKMLHSGPSRTHTAKGKTHQKIKRKGVSAYPVAETAEPTQYFTLILKFDCPLKKLLGLLKSFIVGLSVKITLYDLCSVPILSLKAFANRLLWNYMSLTRFNKRE